MSKNKVSAYSIYNKGLSGGTFDFKRGLEDLIKIDKTGKFIFFAGEKWKEFDYEKGLDAIIRIDKTGNYIFFAGRDWKKLNYEKGLDALIKIDKAGEYVYYAGKYWPKLNYKKAKAYLKKISPDLYYKQALEGWPMSAKDALEKVGNELSGKKKIKDRKFKL